MNAGAADPAPPRPARSAWGPALAGLALVACRASPVQHLRSGYEQARTGATEVRTQTNLVEVSVQDRIGPDLEYRLSDNFVQSTVDVDGPGGRSEDQNTLHRPSLDVAVTSGTVRWSQLFQQQTDRSLSGSGPDNTLVRSDVLQKIEWSPVDLPQLTAWVDFRRVADDFFVDQERVETSLEVRQAIAPFDYEYSFRNETTDDVDVDVRNDRTEHIARLTYQERFFKDRISASASLFATERENVLDLPVGAAPPLLQVTSQAFAAVDATPEISALPTSPGLIDGLSNPTGIDIGGFSTGGEIFWNMAVQTAPGSVVDLIELETADVVPANFVSGFTFSVWSSEDNAFWTLVRSTATFVYEPAFQRFRISIPSVASRFVKVVNTASPAGAPAVLVSEMRVYRLGTTAGSSGTVSDDSVRSATTNLSLRVNERVTLGADLLVQRSESRTDSTRTRDESRFDMGMWASWSPTERVQANLRAAAEFIVDAVLRDESLTTVQGLLSYRPLRTVDVDLSFLQTDRDVDGANDLNTDVAQALATAQLLPTLRAEASLERSQSQDATNERDIDRWIVGAGLAAELTPRLDTTLRAELDDARVTGAGAGAIPDPSEDRYEFTAVYRPGERLVFESELRWIDGFAGQGLDQRWRLDWIPFSDGAVDTQLDYDRTSTSSFDDQRIDRYRAQVRYALAAFTYLELQYAAEIPDEGDSTRIVTLAFAYNR